jgi:hypothetical protein
MQYLCCTLILCHAVTIYSSHLILILTLVLTLNTIPEPTPKPSPAPNLYPTLIQPITRTQPTIFHVSTSIAFMAS